MHEPVDIENVTADTLCKAGQGAACCSFLAMNRGFVCIKGTSMEAAINERRAQNSIKAMGDNCTGSPNFAATPDYKTTL